ncbi:DELLA protein GAI1-like [Henckelia pumila]|uniref:DELLA protein GAI1-like n=1 Tax=Henckelia pumila TaxID=405737 RepID=UPI003C6DD09C
MSIQMIIELAAEKFIHSTSKNMYGTSILSHPYASLIMSGHSEEVQLIQDLLSCAEQVRNNMYQRATKILHTCHRMSSCTGTPVQRLVFYFTEALYEKIDRETGSITTKGLGNKCVDPLEMLKCTDSVLISFHKKLPISQITKFVGVQAIVDHVEESSKVHIIDLEIRCGIQCTILMQALVERSKSPISSLKITAMGSESNKTVLLETGRRLAGFAQSLNLNFCFKVVVVADMLDLRENLFDLDDDEAVAVYAPYTLTSMIGRTERLEHVMKVIRKLDPCVMILIEMEANCNSPNFVDRFVEALFFFGAFFDTIADCMKNEEKNRREAESTCFRASIRNVLGAEGGERKVRHVSIDVWRAYLERFGLVETELSMSCMYQAKLVLESFRCGSNCELEMNGKCLTMSWKGTPLTSLSAWKFQRAGEMSNL